jgi:hypothetical protein
MMLLQPFQSISSSDAGEDLCIASSRRPSLTRVGAQLSQAATIGRLQFRAHDALVGDTFARMRGVFPSRVIEVLS